MASIFRGGIFFRQALVFPGDLLQYSECAYAKINLHLEVLGRRGDGFHDIFSIMSAVGVHDLLQLRISDDDSVCSGKSITVDVENSPFSCVIDTLPMHDNIIYRAAALYQSVFGLNDRLSFTIQKNIPGGAGLGGGSSDGAAALRMLNRHFVCCDQHGLLGIASKTGSDVPFCLIGGIALSEGRGDVVTPVKGVLRKKVLLINDGIHINTGYAYGLLKRNSMLKHSESMKAIRNILEGGISNEVFIRLVPHLRNDFEGPVFSEYPGLKTIMDEVKEFNPDYAAMTGSGSTIFAIFENGDSATEALCAFRGRRKFVVLTDFSVYN